MSDLISRQQAIDALCKSECGCNNAECGHRDNTDFCVTCDNVKIIKSLPSAQPERKTGRWIPCPQNASWLYVYKCSECGGYLQISDVDRIGITAKYCSYCGAKMEGGEHK